MKNLAKYFFLLVFNWSYAQSSHSYVRFYDNDGLEHEHIYQLENLDDSTALVFSVSQMPGFDEYEYQPKVRWLDKNTGTVIQHKYYFSPSAYVLHPYRSKLIEDKFYSVGHVDYGNTSSSFQNEKDYYIAKTNFTSGYEYIELNGDSTKYDRMEDLIFSENGDIYVAGTTKKTPSTTPNNSLVCRHDSMGEKVWCREIDAQILKAYSRAIEMDNAGFLYIMGQDYSSIPTNYQMFLHKMDTLGNLIWTKYYPIDLHCQPIDMDLTSEGNLIISAGVGYEVYDSWVPTFIEIDTAGEINWVRNYWEELEDYGGWGEKFTKTKDGGYAWCINIIKANNVYEPTLIVTDKYGEPILVKAYKDYGLLYPEDLIQLSDGSFMIVGNQPLDNDSLYTYWVLKTDPMGNVTSLVSDTFEGLEINVYPNPSSDILYLEIPQENLKEVEVRIIDNMGSIVMRGDAYAFKYGKNISHLNNGVYYLNIFEGKELVGVRKIIKTDR